MAFNSNNLTLCIPRMGAGENAANAGYSSAQFAYRDITASDNLAAMQVDEFITNAADYGLQVGDVVDFIEDGVAAIRMLVITLTNGNADTVAFS